MLHLSRIEANTSILVADDTAETVSCRRSYLSVKGGFGGRVRGKGRSKQPGSCLVRLLSVLLKLL